jgi:hypothetical protein
MGNKLGWILAGLLVLVVAAFIAVRLSFPPITEPDKTKSGQLLKLKKVQFWPARAAGIKPGMGGDAADDYYRAAAIADANAAKISGILKESEKKAQPVISADDMNFMTEIHNHVAMGTQRASAAYAAKFADRIRITPGFLPARGLRRVADVLFLLFWHYNQQKDFDKAEKVARDMFKMGCHLVDERGHVNIVLVGLQLQILGLGGFEALYKNSPKNDPGAVSDTKEYFRQLSPICDSYNTKMEIVHAMKLHPGDIFNIAEHDEDHAWRVQAVQSLALIKFTVGSKGDKRHVQKLIGGFRKSEDKLISVVAKAADEFTREDFDLYSTPALPVPVTWPPGTEYED